MHCPGLSVLKGKGQLAPHPILVGLLVCQSLYFNLRGYGLSPRLGARGPGNLGEEVFHPD